MNYPQSYHAVCQHLVAFGASVPSNRIRLLAARALRQIRRDQGAAKMRAEYFHLSFISGHLPDKEAK